MNITSDNPFVCPIRDRSVAKVGTLATEVKSLTAALAVAEREAGIANDSVKNAAIEGAETSNKLKDKIKFLEV